MNPMLSQEFARTLAQIQEPAVLTVPFRDTTFRLVVNPGVFPPQQEDFSVSSKSVFETFGDLTGEDVLDLGCGSGVAAIVAALYGARQVDATDIAPEAVACTQHNIAINHLEGKITAWQSDLFERVPKKRYDRIIANLPIVDCIGDPQIPSLITNALYDPGWLLHKRLLAEAPSYLKGRRLIVFTHANLQSRDTEEPEHDFTRLEELIAAYRYRVATKTVREALGYIWINYEITPLPS